MFKKEPPWIKELFPRGNKIGTRLLYRLIDARLDALKMGVMRRCLVGPLNNCEILLCVHSFEIALETIREELEKLQLTSFATISIGVQGQWRDVTRSNTPGDILEPRFLHAPPNG